MQIDEGIGAILCDLARQLDLFLAFRPLPLDPAVDHLEEPIPIGTPGQLRGSRAGGGQSSQPQFVQSLHVGVQLDERILRLLERFDPQVDLLGYGTQAGEDVPFLPGLLDDLEVFLGHPPVVR